MQPLMTIGHSFHETGKVGMPAKTVFPPLMIFTTAIVLGLLLALAVHIVAVRLGLDLGGIWSSGPDGLMPASSAAAWWLVATVGFVSSYVTTSIMSGAASGRIPPRIRQLFVVAVVIILAAAGPAASGGGANRSTASAVIAGLAALSLGAVMAFCGAWFALRTKRGSREFRRDGT